MLRFVFFDFGGVLIKDFSKTNKWEGLMDYWRVKKEQQNEFSEWWDEIEPKLDIGESLTSLLPVFRNKYGVKVDEESDVLGDFVDRFERNEALWSVVREIKKNQRVGLLTNMYPQMLDRIKQVGLLPEVDWDQVVDSSIMGVRKPDEAIFERAEELTGVSGEEILFIENTKRHLETAKGRGWNTYQFDCSDYEKSSSGAMSLYLELTKND